MMSRVVSIFFFHAAVNSSTAGRERMYTSPVLWSTCQQPLSRHGGMTHEWRRPRVPLIASRGSSPEVGGGPFLVALEVDAVGGGEHVDVLHRVLLDEDGRVAHPARVGVCAAARARAEPLRPQGARPPPGWCVSQGVALVRRTARPDVEAHREDARVEGDLERGHALVRRVVEAQVGGAAVLDRRAVERHRGDTLLLGDREHLVVERADQDLRDPRLAQVGHPAPHRRGSDSCAVDGRGVGAQGGARRAGSGARA
jgi:hypothetical protein